jgi:tetratricopeptide (TPR) repeat protein
MKISKNPFRVRLLMPLAAAFVMIVSGARGASAENLHFQRLARATDYGKVYTELGENAVGRGHYLRAVRVLSAAIQKGAPVEAFKFRAQAHYHLNRYDKALADVNQYLAKRPEDLTARILRGDLYNLKLDHERALRDFEQAVKLAPASEAAHLGRGIAYVGLEEYDRAIESFRKALELHPHNADALVDIGVASLLAGKSEKALEAFQEALQAEVAPDVRERVQEWIARLR